MESLKKSTQLLLAFGFGVTALIVLLGIGILKENPNALLITVSRVTLALACAGVAAVIPGFIDLKFSQGAAVLIRSGGAIAVFVLVYVSNPPGIIPDPPPIPPDPPSRYESVAQSWLDSIDRGNFGQAYDSSSALTKQRFDRNLFIKTFSDYLTPLGPITRRTLIGVTSFTQLPSGDRGNFRVLTYSSGFQSGANKIEILVLAAENNRWVVNDHTYYNSPDL